MIDNESEPVEVKGIGAHLPRARHSEGTLYKVGSRSQKNWKGLWYVYVTVDGVEKRRQRKKILGPVTIPKDEAQKELRRLIQESRGGLSVKPHNPTFADAWERYASLKEAEWSTTSAVTVRGIFTHNVLPTIGAAQLSELTLDPVKRLLIGLAKQQKSQSMIKQARTYIKAVFEWALDEKWISENPVRARKLTLPTKLMRKECGDFYSLDEVRRLLSAAEGREHLILRLFVVAGVRSQELFALRVDDIAPGRLRIDEAIKRKEKGEKRLGSPKTEAADGYVAMTPAIEWLLREWLQVRQPADDRAFIFPSGNDGAIRPENYLKRTLKPLATAAGIGNITYQALRRTFTTHFQKHGSPRDAQAQLRHTNMKTTNRYMKELPESVAAAVESLDNAVTAEPVGGKVLVMPAPEKAARKKASA